jgi:hypothetical protein
MREPRLAATIFIQPALDAFLRPLPIPGLAKNGKRKPSALTYGAWKEQKYERYYKKSLKRKE